jgi:hypothetical protein
MKIGLRQFKGSRALASIVTTTATAVALTILPVALTAQEPSAAARAKPSGGQAEGIKVHGQWTIEVRNPDGTLASRTDFHNDLDTTTGSSILSLLLARQATPGYWFVFLYESSSSGPCLNFLNAQAPCMLSEPSTNFSGSDSTNLTVTSPTSGANAGKVVLAGMVTAERNATIDGVVTQVLRCPATGSPSTPCSGPIHTFTIGHPPAVSVVTGQIVQVTVVISFS